MMLSGFVSAWSRRFVVTAALWAGIAGASAWGQEAAPPDQFKFSSDAGVMIYTIKAENVADFEAMWASIRTKLAASDKPDYKALNESLKIYKIEAVTPEGQTYFFVADPASKTTSYGLSPFLLFTSGLFTRAEAEELFKKLQPAIVNLSSTPVKKLP